MPVDALIVNPAGIPGLADQLKGGVPAVTPSVWEYGRLAVPFGRGEAVVIVSPAMDNVSDLVAEPVCESVTLMASR